MGNLTSIESGPGCKKKFSVGKTAKKKKPLVSNSTIIPEIRVVNKKVINESLAVKGHGLKMRSSKFKMPLILEEEFFKIIDMGKALGFDYKNKEVRLVDVFAKAFLK